MVVVGISRRKRKVQDAPDDRSGEVHLIVRTRQRAFLIRLANIRHVREQPDFRADLYESGEDRRDQLHCVRHIKKKSFRELASLRRSLERTKESRPRRDLDIVAQLEILHERRRLRQRLDRIRLEHHIRHRLPRADRRGDNLREQVERNLLHVIPDDQSSARQSASTATSVHHHPQSVRDSISRARYQIMGAPSVD